MQKHMHVGRNFLKEYNITKQYNQFINLNN